MNIAVIGGGPGGLYAAIEAAKCDINVTLFEQGMVGEHIHCGEGFFDSFGVLGCPTHGVCFPVEKIRLQLEHIYEKNLDKYNNIWMIDRAIWQRSLRDEARQRGVIIHECNHINGEECKRLQNHYEWVIDASGVFPVSSQVYGFRQHFIDHAGVAYQYVMEGDFSAFIRAVKVGFFPDFLGYYWIFPKSADTANVGIGYLDKRHAPQDKGLKTLLQRVVEIEQLQQAKVVKCVGGILPNRVLERLVYDNLLLVGGAAGLCSPLHGEGIDLACISGKLAAQAVAGEGTGVDQYADIIHKFVNRKMAIEYRLIDLWKKCDFHVLEDIIQAMIEKDMKKICKYSIKFPVLLKAAGHWLRMQPTIGL